MAVSNPISIGSCFRHNALPHRTFKTGSLAPKTLIVIWVSITVQYYLPFHTNQGGNPNLLHF
jgi:hypothetical protein